MSAKARSEVPAEAESLKAALEQSRRRLETVCRFGAGAVVILDVQDRVAFASETAAELVGRRPEDLRGLGLADLFSEAGLAGFEALRQEARGTPGRPAGGNLGLRSAWGPGMELEVHLVVPAGAGETYLFFQDPSSARLREKELLKINQFLRHILMNSAEGIIATEISGNIILFNQSASRMLGWTEEEVLGRKHVTELYEPGKAREIMERLRGDDPRDGPPGWLKPMDVVLITKSGQRLPTNLAASIIYDRGREVGTVGIFTDLRERLAMEKALDMIITTDLSGRIASFNKAAERILGYDREEVLGLEVEKLYPDPAERRALQERVEKEEAVVNYETRLRRKDGSLVDISLSLSLLRDNEGRTLGTVGVSKDITLRKKALAELQSTRDYLENLVENASDMIITTDLATNIVSWNRAAEENLGYRREEIIGRSVEVLYPDPAERRALMKHVEAMGRVIDYETQLRRVDGSLMDIALTLSQLRDNEGRVIGTVGISKDITDRKKAEAELRKTRDYLNCVLEASMDMIITTDLSDRIVSFNEAAEGILYWERNDVLGRPVKELFVKPEEWKALRRQVEAQEAVVNYETRLQRRDGERVDIDLTLSLLRDNEGRIIGTVGVSKDVTERKRVEAELREKQVQLEEAHQQVMHAEKMASLGKLATSVAHEINNPLGGILMFAQMILEEMAAEDPRRGDMSQIVEQTLRCKEIVKGLLEFGRMTETHYTFIDLNRSVEQGIALFANQALFHNIKVERRLDPDLPQIMGDGSQLNQVFTNLIINAVDAMAGQGTLTITTRLEEEAGEVVVEFSDTGRGIEPEVLPRIFEPFFTTKPVGEGAGLGLSTSYGIVAKHNGRIEVRSTPGQGSTFAVHLPLEGPGEEASPASG